MLAGIYRPTSGSIAASGRISALLELGAGFHGELTGRENVYLNGAILGLTRKQIDAAMDEIIDFSGIGDFIDSPVKVYSSGMYVRLGFSIAVTADPEILIVDEIIAVGDEEFQRKCFDYLYELRRQGTTIVIVSHSLPVVGRPVRPSRLARPRPDAGGRRYSRRGRRLSAGCEREGGRRPTGTDRPPRKDENARPARARFGSLGSSTSTRRARSSRFLAAGEPGHDPDALRAEQPTCRGRLRTGLLPRVGSQYRRTELWLRRSRVQSRCRAGFVDFTVERTCRCSRAPFGSRPPPSTGAILMTIIDRAFRVARSRRHAASPSPGLTSFSASWRLQSTAA